MRILHTADWHVGKKLGRFDRLDECRAALDRLIDVASEEKVDLVIVAGDLFDRALPPFQSLGVVLDALVRLARTGARVVAVAGNHDSAELFRVLGPYLETSGVTLIGRPLAPEQGGVLRVPARDSKQVAQVACLPFLHEAQIVDFMEGGEEWFKSYAERIRRITSHYARWMSDNSDPSTVEILIGHFMVDGAVPSGSERQLHIGEAYMATDRAIPPEINYAALGHIHLSQEAPGSGGRGWYSGSLMQLDFGEMGQTKQALLVDVDPVRPGARVQPVPIETGRQLIRVVDTLDAIRARADEFGDAILDVGVLTDGPYAGLSDEVREFLPNALYVRAVWDRLDDEEHESREGLSLPDLYGRFVLQRHEVEPSKELMDAFRALCEESGVHL